jgi:hypothetical protein
MKTKETTAYPWIQMIKMNQIGEKTRKQKI